MKVCQLGLSGILALRLLWNLFKELFQILRHSCHPAYGFDDNAWCARYSLHLIAQVMLQQHLMSSSTSKPYEA